MDYQHIIEKLEHKISKLPKTGKVANYIPELQKVNPDKFGLHLSCVDGKDYAFGDSNELFSIQSISKVYTLALAKEIVGDDLWKRVNVEPSGNAYNSLTQLENENGIPRNPFINAGSIVVADLLLSVLENPKDDLLNFVRKISKDESIAYDERVAESEKATGSRNVALIYYMKSLGNIKNNPEAVLDFYFYQCSLNMSCKQLATSYKIFADDGKLSGTNHQVFNNQSVKRINSIMQTCGFYDEAGEFSYRVGLPGKSGVGGGIVAVHPRQFSVAVWSPKLNDKGNSSLGMKALEELTNLTGLSIF
ncbi:glutaminase [Psychroflexus planctonicus]|uniref:Glutaminase n=1 Tax=Psychroflexus planctonicus TaxID=1526575 RepID=A0ABQ1SN00_9FLAO|nr:glutaminase [Psychroflexus planctonicus]GGE43488.1 glutaminase [Psychroflexus planctonicus]